MTFDETLLVAAAEIDAVIADDLARLAERVRRDLIATAHPDDPPDWIERNIAAVLKLDRRRLRAWRKRVLLLYALDRHTPATRPC